MIAFFAEHKYRAFFVTRGVVHPHGYKPKTGNGNSLLLNSKVFSSPLPLKKKDIFQSGHSHLLSCSIFKLLQSISRQQEKVQNEANEQSLDTFLIHSLGAVYMRVSHLLYFRDRLEYALIVKTSLSSRSLKIRQGGESFGLTSKTKSTSY